MKVKWLGHASFLITSQEGTRIITDPYKVVGGLSYDPVNESADIVTVSHEHGDHNNTAGVAGNPDLVKGPGVTHARGIEFQGIAAYHDASQGKERGPDTIFCFTVDGIRLCHLGDLGAPLSTEQVKEIGKVDIVMLPVGGFYTIDAAVASSTLEALNPRVALPMHYKTDKCSYPIAGVDDFLKGKKNVRRPGSTEVELTADNLPRASEIIVLQHAL
ncbi:MAG: MBL fold metallo-hydrolase [Chloroflexota bacterium]